MKKRKYQSVRRLNIKLTRKAAFVFTFVHSLLTTMPHNQNISSSLIERFEKIYESSYFKLYSFVKYYTWSEDTVKDVLQECYIRLWENLPSVQDDEKLMPLLRTYAMNITIDAVRKKGRELERAAIYHSRQPEAPSADEGLYLRELLLQYRQAVNNLPSQQRKVFQLIREQGLSHEEAAEILNISTHTIKRHMQEALRTLRSKFPVETLSLLLILSQWRGR